MNMLKATNAACLVLVLLASNYQTTLSYVYNRYQSDDDTNSTKIQTQQQHTFLNSSISTTSRPESSSAASTELVQQAVQQKKKSAETYINGLLQSLGAYGDMTPSSTEVDNGVSTLAPGTDDDSKDDDELTTVAAVINRTLSVIDSVEIDETLAIESFEEGNDDSLSLTTPADSEEDDYAIVTTPADSEEVDVKVTTPADSEEVDVKVTTPTDSEEVDVKVTTPADSEEDDYAIVTTPADSEEVDVKVTTPVDSEEDDYAIVTTPADSEEVDVKVTTPADSEEVDVKVTTPADSEEVDVKVTTPADSEEVDVKVTTPADSEEDEYAIVTTPADSEEVDVKVTTPVDSEEDDYAIVTTPAESEEVDVKVTTPADSEEVDVKVTTPVDSEEDDYAIVTTPADSEEVDMKVTTPADSEEVDVIVTTPADSEEVDVIVTTPADSEEVDVKVTTPADSEEDGVVKVTTSADSIEETDIVTVTASAHSDEEDIFKVTTPAESDEVDDNTTLGSDSVDDDVTTIVPTESDEADDDDSTTKTPTDSDEDDTDVITTTARSESNEVTDVSTSRPNLCDGCEFKHGVGYNRHPSDCTLFIQCRLSAITHLPEVESVQSCPHGQYWNQFKLTCDFQHNVKCFDDVCRGNKTTKISGASCRGFWDCGSGTAVAKCCPAGFAYNPVTADCFYQPSCQDSCLSVVHFEHTNFECGGLLRAVLGDITVYEMKTGNTWMRMPCPPTLGFSAISPCGCSIPLLQATVQPKKPECVPELHLPFDVDAQDKSGRNVWVKNEGVLVKYGKAFFDGHSRLTVNRFSNAWWGATVYVQIRYKPLSTGAAELRQALVSNGDCQLRPSLAVCAGPKGVDFYAETQDSAKPANFTVPYVHSQDDDSGWHNVLYRLDDNTLYGSLNNNTVQAPAKGVLESRQRGLVIGSGGGCKDFEGFIDELTVYLCRPEL